MAEDAYNKKIGDLQKHIPFLENMIAQLKDPKGKPREAQLSKLEAVHNMITDRNKKWKFETLLKCEEVITKLQTKVKANRLSVFPEAKELFRTDRTKAVSQTVSEIMNALKFSNARAKLNSEIATPKSPSPVREPTIKLPPKIIPTENTKSTFKIDPDDFNIRSWKTANSAITEERYVNERPDIYNSAAKSLISPPAKPKSIFDRLGPVVSPDASKPLLSDADLESLRAGDDFEVVPSASPDEIRKDKEKPPSDLTPSKSTPRIVPVPSSKPKNPKLECPKQPDEKRPSVPKTKAPPPKVEKLKDCDMFGNLLTSIDSKILEGSKKKEGKKKEHDKKSAKRHEKSKAEPVVKAKEEKIEVKVEVPGDKPVRLADKYNPKPKKHVDSDLEKTVDDSIQKRMENDPRISLKIDIFTNSNSKDRNFESRDPRRRLSVMQESPPPQQQQQPHYAPPQPQRPIIELPIRDPRRPQSRFSPPPIQISPFAQAQTYQNFAPPPQARNVFNNNHGVAPYQQQQNYFNQNYPAPSLRYDPNPPSVRFEPPPLSQAGSFGTAPKKSFNPFEPLDSGREEKESPAEFFIGNNQPLQSPPLESQNFQRGIYGPASRGGGGAAKFRGGAGYYNQYSNRQDRARFDRNNEFRRPAGNANKSSEASWDRTKKDEAYKYPKDVSRTKYDEIYSKLEKDKETFTSPLESLYSDPKSSIKATIQSFKIPKKYKTEEAEAPHVEKHKEGKPPVAKVKEEPKAKRNNEESSCAEIADVLLTKKKKKKKKIKKVRKAPSPPSPELARQRPADEDSSDDSDVPLKVAKKKPIRVRLKKKPLKDSDDSDDDVGRKSRRAKIVAKKRLIEDSDETDSDETRRVVQSPKPREDKDDVVRNIEVKDLKIVVEKNIDLSRKIEEIKAEGGPSKEQEHSEASRVKAEEEKPQRKAKSDVELAKELLMETNAGMLNVNDKQLIEFVLQNFKKIHQLFNRDSSGGSDAEDGTEAKKKDKRKELEVKQEGEQQPQQEEQEKPPPPPPEPQKVVEEETPKVKPVIRRKPGPKPKGRFKKGGAVKKENNVGRMTRTRSATLLAVPRRARRSELDKLHEDIKEMLMGGEVLTASTKRACTIQKDEQEDAPEKTTSDDENLMLNKVMDPSRDDPTKIKAKGAKLRVLIEKTDLAKLLIKDELKKKEEDVDVEVEEEIPEEKGEEVLGGDDIFEPQIDKGSPRQLRIFKKKKRRFNWASGVIKKKKKGAGSFQKAPPSSENKNAPSDDDAESLADPFGSFPELGELVYIEPDKEYYPKDGKSDCKLCSFQGKFIVQHYKGVHPEHEVLIARMNPTYAHRAVQESANNNYESVEAHDMLNVQKTKKKRFSYQCPFCHIKFFNENTEVFYDHLSGHTGEYRFSCPFCNFRTSTGRNLRPHIMTSHNRSSENVVKPSWPPPPNFKYVFGYLCAECHYVQLNKNAVEDHVKIYHLENQKIHKVNMSAMPCEEIDDGEGEIPEIAAVGPSEIDRHVDETIERVVHAEKEPVAFPVRPRRRRTKRNATVPAPQVKQLRVFELIDEIAPIIKDEPPDETEATPPELQAATPSKQKSPDLNAFMCNPDMTAVEEQSVEENRLKKMKEIHEIVKPARTSIVDKLQSRLYTTPSSPPEEVQNAAPPISDPIGPEVMPPPPPLFLIDRTPAKKSIDSIINKNTIATEVLPQKSTAPISSIINRLQDKLVGEVNKLPPLTHYRNLKTENAPELSLRIGPVQVMLNKAFILYACFVPTCVFCTDKQNIFETHCKYTHKNYVCTFEEPNKCDVCHVKIDHEGNYVSMHDAYLHLIGTHGDFLEKLEAKKYETVEEEQQEKEKAAPPSFPEENVVPEFKLPHEVPNLISQGDDENTGAKYPFVITSVTSLAPPKKNSYEEVAASALSSKTPASSSSSGSSSAAVIRPVPLSKLRVTTADVITTPTSGATLTLSTSSKSQPLGLNTGSASVAAGTPQKKPPPVFNKFVITSTSPSTTLPQQPVLLNHYIGNHQLTSGNVLPKIPTLTLATNVLGPSPTKTATPAPSPSATSPKRQIILRDIPLKLSEKLQSRKSPKALGALLHLKKNRQLFKCPEFYCIFSTDLSVELNKHMTAFHNFTDQALLSCLYCDYKVSCETYAIHVEVKHGHCAYGCEYCLYRTTCVYFIGIHQELQHPQLPNKIISIPLFPSSVKAISSDATVSLRKIVLPYVCGNLGCSFKTLFTGDFFDHLEGHAKTLRCSSCTRQFATPNAMVTHWTNHKVYPFHCRYCLYGNKATHGIGRHQACCHQSFDYSVICRIFVSDSTGRQPADYNCDEDEVYQRLLKWPEDSNTPEGKTLMKTYKNLAEANQVAPVATDKEDENKGKANEIEVIQLSMDHILAKQDEEVVGPPEEKLCLDEPAIFTSDGGADSDDVDPLSLDTTTLETLQKEIEEKKEENSGDDVSDPLDEESFGPEEPCGRNLYKCKCDADFLSSVELRTHIMQCQKQKPFLCAHCARPFKTITGLMHHYRDHGPARFKCSLCQFKRRHQFAVRTHMKVVHNVGNVMLLPVVAKKVDMDNDDFVLRPRQCGRKSTDSSTVLPTKPSVEEAPTAEAKYVFGPNEIDLLPRPPIYQFDVKCATCSYATKVKSNMVRHLQFHQTEQEVPVIAPVNPVPCLEKSERMFDKMVNLASSSHVGGRMGGVKNEKPDKGKAEEAVNIPAFVPTGKRYICGAENCNYLCPEEAMLRRHLTAFHSDDGIYTCHHCKIKISEEKSLNIESVMKHLKLHDCNLYQCLYCKMINHLRHKMDRHLTEKHFDKAPNMLIIREKVKASADSDPASILEKELSKEAKPWRCGMCKYRCPSFNEIKSHASNKHNVDAKHKCALCSYKGELKDSFAEHFEKKHPGHQPDVIVCYFKDELAEKPKPPPTENEPEFNTTPLWQRNKHVKHIRGILLEESNVPEKTPKKIKPSPKPAAAAKKDDAEDGAAASPKKSSALGIVEAPGPRTNQKTFKIVKRALKTKGGKVLKMSGYKFESSAPAVVAKKSDEFIDIISCEDAAAAAKQNVESVEDKTIETPSATTTSTTSTTTTTTTTTATKRSLKLVNIQTLLEDPSGSEMPGFVNITNVIRETPGPAGGDLETIEILDDDSGGGSGEVSSKKRKIDLTFREINKMSKSELLAGNYMGTYGPYGSPWDGKYKCPLCEKMTCRSEREFTVHLYRELQYGAYKCNVCGETDLSDEAIRKHYALKHGVINSDDIVQMGWDRQIEAWIHKVIAFQSRILKLEKKPKAEGGAAEPEKTAAVVDALETEEDGEKGRTLYCTFCDYRCKYSGDRRKHELRHWSTKPFSCGYCAYEAIYKSVMVKHMHRFHKGSEVLVHENEMDDGVIIKPIKIIKKKGGGGASSQAEEPPWVEPPAAGDSSQEAALSKMGGQAQNFQCFYCDFVGTMSEQTMHREVHHSILPLKLYSYKCNYCEMVFVTLVSLNAHFFGAHPGLEQDFTSVECKTDKKFRCPTCFYTSDDYSVVKYHVRGHFKPFRCLYCDERFSYWNQIYKHHSETHPASFYEYKYILSVEKDTWTEMEAIQVRRGGSYEVITETKSTKRRKHPKRLDPANNNNTAEEDEAEEEDDDVMIIEDESSQAKKPAAPGNETAAAAAAVADKVMRATARKSTSVHVVKAPPEGFSYYGTRPDDTDLTDIITTVEIMGASVTMYVEQLSRIFNLFPIVLVEDCGPL